MDKPFYEQGLRFHCTRCSRCCRFTPGYVFLSHEDLPGLLRATGLNRDDFLKTFCRSVAVGGFVRISLKEKDNLDCIFWGPGGCSIYRNRPLQCRSFPFWNSNLDSRQRWELCGASCPGIDQGRRHSRREIESWLRVQGRVKMLEIV